MNKSITTLAAATALVFASLSVQAMDHGQKHTKAKSGAMAASGAIAEGEGPGKLTQPVKGETARSEVKAEAKQAVAAGTVAKGEGSPSVAKTQKGDTTRAEVKAEAAAAVKHGDIAKGPNVPTAGGVAKP